MITLKFKVTETEVRLIEKSDRLVSGNVEQIKCIFELSKAYDGLVVRASFNGVWQALVGGECFAPELNAGECEIGVYGFEVDGDKLKRRISPIACREYVYQGTYSKTLSEGAEPSPTELECFYATIREVLNNALGFKLITTIEEAMEIFSYDENGEPNFDCRTIYAMPIYFLGGTYNTQDFFFEFMIREAALENKEDDVLSNHMEMLGTLGLVDFNNYVTQEQLESKLGAKADSIYHSAPYNAIETIQLKDNTEFSCQKSMEALSVQLPQEPGRFRCTIIFHSPSPATQLTAHSRIKFIGDDCTDGIFTPAENTSYEIDVKYISVSTILAKVTAF